MLESNYIIIIVNVVTCDLIHVINAPVQTASVPTTIKISLYYQLSPQMNSMVHFIDS